MPPRTIDSISAPASEMLRMIFAAIPNIIAAAVLLGIGYLISRFVVQIVKEILPGLGVDRAMAESGLVTEGTTVSGIIARVAQVAIILFFAIAATRLLGFPELTAILDQLLELCERLCNHWNTQEKKPAHHPMRKRCMWYAGWHPFFAK